jgi:hypothetical protein
MESSGDKFPLEGSPSLGEDMMALSAKLDFYRTDDS